MMKVKDDARQEDALVWLWVLWGNNMVHLDAWAPEA